MSAAEEMRNRADRARIIAAARAAANGTKVCDGFDDEGRPIVRVSFEVHKNTDAAISALAHDGGLYQRTDTLVHVARLADEDVKHSGVRVRAAAGTPRVYPATAANLVERLSRCSRWEHFVASRKKDAAPGDGEWRQTHPPPRVVAAVLDRRAWSGIPTLVGVAETPVLRADGSILDRPGFDEATGYLYLPSETFDQVPASPTRADAVAALAALDEVFCDFPYAAATHRAVPIAAMLTLLARPAIAGAVPAFAFDASTPGSGKTHQTNACAVIVTGRTASMASWPRVAEEQEKVLGAIALQGDGLVCFDNQPAGVPFGGPALDRCLTCIETVQLRVLGKSEAPVMPWRTVVFVSGNNLQLGGDTPRRVLVARLEPADERPEERTGFRHPRLLEWVKAERHRLVPAALTILRAYVVAGRPPMGLVSWGGFEPWVELVASAIVWAGGANVLDARAACQEIEAPEVTALRSILRGLAKFGSDGITAKRLVEVLYPVERLRPRFDAAPLEDDGHDDTREAIESLVSTKPGTPPDSVRLGFKLRSLKGRRLDGLRLDTVRGHAGAARWLAAKVST